MPFTVEEEKSLVSQARSGDQRALERIIELMRPSLYSTAKKMGVSHVEIDDLVQAGVGGILDAFRRYDPSRGVRFMTYAHYHVYKWMKNEITESGLPFRVPPPVYDAARKVHGSRMYLFHDLGREPTDEEVSKHSGVELSDVKNCGSLFCPVDSLYHRDDEGEESYEERLVADQTDLLGYVIQEEERDELIEALESLDQKEREVIRMRFGLQQNPMRVEDICNRMKMGERQCRTHLKEGLQHLRNYLETRKGYAMSA